MGKWSAKNRPHWPWKKFHKAEPIGTPAAWAAGGRLILKRAYRKSGRKNTKKPIQITHFSRFSRKKYKKIRENRENRVKKIGIADYTRQFYYFLSIIIDKTGRKIKKKIKPHFIITYFRVVVKPRFFYRGCQMELFRVHLKIFRSNENRVGIIENFQMKTPEGIRGILD